jgi:hypothetical protein
MSFDFKFGGVSSFGHEIEKTHNNFRFKSLNLSCNRISNDFRLQFNNINEKFGFQVVLDTQNSLRFAFIFSLKIMSSYKTHFKRFERAVR